MVDEKQEEGQDAPRESGVTRRTFMKVSAGTVACISLGSLSFGCAGGGAARPGYPIDGDVRTTLERTVVPGPTTGAIKPPYLNQISLYEQNGYGGWTFGGPLPAERRTDLMPQNYVYPAINNPVKLLRFFTITDIHITDKESPSQTIYLQPLNLHGFEAGATSCYSPTMLYTTQVLDAAVQTVNALHRQEPIDFGISLGDAANSTQYNETRWYIDVLDGREISPSSGAHDGAARIDYQKPFKAAGLDPAIPWYQAVGNHDHFWIGSIPPDDPRLNLRASCTSDKVLAMGDALANSDKIYSTDPPRFYMGVIDGSTPDGNIIKCGKVEDFSAPPTVVPDTKRRSLTKPEWIAEFFRTATRPVGHGFNLVPPGQEEGFGCYSFLPKSDIPLKVIVLDNTQREDDGSNSIHGHGFLDQARWTWLKKELKDGDDAGQLMIIAAHVPIGVQKRGSFMEWFDKSINSIDAADPGVMQNAVDLPGLLAELHSHPNLLMWIAGHRHINTVKAFATDIPAEPERGFWQVETSSLHDFPQQMRLFDVRLNSDFTVSIVTVNVDPAVREGTPAATSRAYAVAAQQIVNTKTIYQNDPDNNYVVDPATQNKVSAPDPSIRPMPTGSYNAELCKKLSPAMKAKLQALFPMP